MQAGKGQEQGETEAEQKEGKGVKKGKKKPQKVCGDCIHLDACAGQNLTGVVYMMETDATCCGNYETIWSLFDRVKPLVEKYMRDQKDNREELREQRARLGELQALRSELETRNRIIDELNRRIDWMQSSRKGRFN